MTDAELRSRLAATAPSGDVMVPRATLERLLRSDSLARESAELLAECVHAVAYLADRAHLSNDDCSTIRLMTRINDHLGLLKEASR